MAACNNEVAPFTTPTFGGAGGGTNTGTVNPAIGGNVANTVGGAAQATSGGSGQAARGGSGQGGSSSTNAAGGAKASGGNAQIGGTKASGGNAQTGGAKASGGTTQVGGNAAVGGSTGQTGGSTAISVGGGTSTGPLGGYHVHGDWAGFAFTYGDGGATITPDQATGFRTLTDKDGPYCAKGSILGAYTSSAAIGFNTKQEKVADAPTGKITPSGTGLMVNVSNPGKSASLRVQIEDGTDPKATDANLHRWCVNISEFDKNIVIPWESFNTECWSGGKGTAFNPTTQIAKALVFLPSDGKTTLNFDFCVNDIGPDTVKGRGTGTIGSSCNNTVSWPQSSITGQFDNVASGDNKYRFQSNGWGWQGGGSHSITLSTSAGFAMTSQSCSRSDSTPCSFPSIYIGTSADGKRSSYTAKQVSAITSAPTCLAWKAGAGANDEYNVSYDVWFNDSSGASAAGAFLMVWLRKPPTFQPAGAPKADGVVIGSQTWTVWFGPNHEQKNVVSYLAVPNNLAQGQAYSFNLKDFIDDAVERGYLTKTQYMIAVMGGMEIWGGGAGAAITGFKAEVL